VTSDPLRRAGLLDRLAALVRREVPLPLALGSLGDGRRDAAVDRGVALASEGRPLGEALVAAGLIDAADASLVEAGEGRDPGRGLRLLAQELRARAEVSRTLTAAIVRPVLKLLGALLLLFLVAGLLGAEAEAFRTSQITPRPIFAWNPPPPREALPAARSVKVIGLTVAALVGAAWLLARSRAGRGLLERATRDVPIMSTLLGLEVTTRFLRVLGTALAAGLDLPAALERARDAFAGRPVARELQAVVTAAREGNGLVSCLNRAPIATPTAQWVAGIAAERPDPARELLELADEYEARLVRECAHWGPVFGGIADLVVVVGIGAPMVLMATHLKDFFF
jgi:type II secretory pathway component PulF